MSRGKLLYKYFALLSVFVSFTGTLHALPESLDGSIVISAQVLLILAPSYPLYDKPTNPLSGVPLTVEGGSEVVLFKGSSYPNSMIYILKNGLVVDKVQTDRAGNFSSSLRDLNPGTYTFGLRAEMPSGESTELQSFSVVITSGITTIIDNVLITPTLTIDKSQVRFGDYITFTGKGSPNQSLNIYIYSVDELDRMLHLTTRISGSGEWSYQLKSSDLSLGEYTIQVQATGKTGVYSPRTTKQKFLVSDKNAYISIRQKNSYCDINNDGYVNLFDFSILAFWYKRFGFPSNVDLSGDESVDLVDFSILAYCWTG